MPDKPKRDAIARQWELLKLLPSRSPGKTARELADALGASGFAVSKRTVERDLVQLSVLFPIQCNDKGAPYGWHWIPGAELDVPGITVSEALSLRMIAQYLGPLLPAPVLQSLEPKFRLASAKLDGLGASTSAARWFDKVRTVAPALPLLPPEIASEVLEGVQDALLADEQLDVEYRAGHAERPSAMRLHPLALVQRGPVTYLVATAFDYEDVRLFAVHRVVAATRIREPARRPRGFELDRYIASGALEFGSGSLRLEAKVSADLARILTETPLADDMTLVAKGDHFTLQATVGDTWQLRWWILSQGDAMEVIRPARLRKEIARLLEGAARQYNDLR